MVDVPLLIADAEDLTLGTLVAPAWGIYLNGSPVIQSATIASQAALGFVSSFDSLPGVAAIAAAIGAPNIVPVTASTIDFEYDQDRPISNYPQEQGAFQSYDKVTLPFDVKVKLACGGSTSRRQAFISTCLGISQSLSLFDVVTPELTFQSVNCTRIGWKRNARHGVTLILIDLWFEQVPVTATTSFLNTQQPGNAGQQSIGNVQPTTPNQQVQSAFDAFGAD
jgi:hypothetical protein